MKRLAIILGIVAVLAAATIYNVWHSAQVPVTTPPGLVEQGRQKLHEQLEQGKQNESQLEKQAWNSIPQLRQLIDWHQHRIEKLTGNSQAGEILAYDHDSIARLEKRIADLVQQEQARQEALAAQAAQAADEAQQQQQQPQAAPPPKQPHP